MDRSLFGFIWRYSKRQQLIILALTVTSFPILYMTLELPKWIVNDAISGTDFPKDLFGIELEQIPYLLVLCFMFLGLVVANNAIKYVLNMTKGVSGERMLRRLRFMLYNSVLRFRLQRFRRVSGGEIIPMITAEVEDVGVFIGEAIATPAFQGGTLLVYITFIFAQDPFLGAAAVSLYPFQAYIIPKLQRRVIMLTRERIKNIRTIADRIGETVSAAPDIHANDTARYHMADLSDRLFINYRIRLAIFKRKFMIKFLNNFLNQLPPFFFYSVGGYLVIQGELSFGALVAVLAAYKDLASPWKELLKWYQNLANVSTKYETVVEAFDVDDKMPSERLGGDESDSTVDVGNELAVQSATVSAGGSSTEVSDVSLTVSEGEKLAVYGRDGSGRTELLMTMAGLYDPVSGRATLGGKRFQELSHCTIAKAVAYVGSDPFVFNDTLRANVVYSLRGAPQDEDKDELAMLRRAEAILTGNSLHAVHVPWEDFGRAGVSDADALDDRLLELFEVVGLAGDLYRLGLSARLDEAEAKRLADKILTARSEVVRRVGEDRKLADLVELWDPKKINFSATLGENIIFGVPTDPGIHVWDCAHNKAIQAALRKAGIFDRLVKMGATIAETMIELFGETGADASLIGDYSFVSADELPLFEERLRALRAKGINGLREDVACAFISLAFRLIPARHRIITVDEELEKAILTARPILAAELKDDKDHSLFDVKAFSEPLSVEENILFGKPRADRRGARERIDELLRDTIASLELRDPIARAGLNFSVGVAGGRLSGGQRRRVGLVRAIIKRPHIVIIDQVADGDVALLDSIKSAVGDATLIIGTADPAVAKRFENVAVMRDAELVATGSWDTVSDVALGNEDAA